MNFLSLSVYWGLRFVFQRCGPISELFSSVRSEIVQDSWRAPQLNREQAPTRRQAWSKQPPSNTAQTVSWTRSCQTPWLYMQLGEHTHTHTDMRVTHRWTAVCSSAPSSNCNNTNSNSPRSDRRYPLRTAQKLFNRAPCKLVTLSKKPCLADGLCECVCECVCGPAAAAAAAQL